MSEYFIPGLDTLNSSGGVYGEPTIIPEIQQSELEIIDRAEQDLLNLMAVFRAERNGEKWEIDTEFAGK